MALLEPKIVENVFDQNFYNKLFEEFKSSAKSGYYEEGFGRYTLGPSEESAFKEAFDKAVEIARVVFNKSTLLPSYAFFAHYEKKGNALPSLLHHRDDNACTYTLDMCVYQTEPWDLYVENSSYTLYPNQALAYYGNDQEHWRNDMPNPEEQHVAMIFFHFVEPDHWFYKKGPSYIEVIRGNVSEESWTMNHQK